MGGVARACATAVYESDRLPGGEVRGGKIRQATRRRRLLVPGRRADRERHQRPHLRPRRPRQVQGRDGRGRTPVPHHRRRRVHAPPHGRRVVMSETPTRRLLILGCSDRKNDVAPDSPQQLFSFMTKRRARSLAAWEIYAGVAFQVVKRCQREGAFPPDIDIVILSAKYGIITPEREITYYDLKMTPELAGLQRATNVRILGEMMGTRSYREIFLMMGR